MCIRDRYAPLALSFPYVYEPWNIQRLLKQQGWTMLFHEPTSGREQPGFYVAADARSKEAVLAVRGTKHVMDVFTNANALPECFQVPLTHKAVEQNSPDANTEGEWLIGMAHGGMASAALWLELEVGSVLAELHHAGFSITLVGHSLGAGVASLLALRLSALIPSIRCVSYAAPACMDCRLAEASRACVDAIILHDDIVPRASARNVLELFQDLSRYSKQWPDLFKQDLRAVTGRMKRLWEPPRRGAKRRVLEEAELELDREISFKQWRMWTALKKSVSKPGEEELQAISLEEEGEKGEVAVEEGEVAVEEGTEPVDVDEMDAVVDEMDAVVDEMDAVVDEMDAVVDAAVDEMGAGPEREAPLTPNTRRAVEIAIARAEADQAGHLGPHERHRLSLTTLYTPGSIVHLYQHHGVMRGAEISCDHPTLTRIEPYANMVKDHLSSGMWTALKSVTASMAASKPPPTWQRFCDAPVCACCNSDFTWASTSSGDAQQMLDRRNCPSCGLVVCDGCSQHTRPLHSIGIVEPVRVCDGCHFSTDWLKEMLDDQQHSDATAPCASVHLHESPL
eukprot:TRINITY_DN3557_c0_g1_i1.p1 TRINITY_DN3557_c0_g1~~TRINITY_DN3557_c0_g1_i1.p1  ORF type:complete len:566 (-),score=97.44 TRINITY_DN3557_c0_g1_i1:125-1822(-)